jgi:hypothetical protein
VRDVIAKIDLEISESGSLIVNLRENICIRRLAFHITATHWQAGIDSCDMKGAAKAERNFVDRYQVVTAGNGNAGQGKCLFTFTLRL